MSTQALPDSILSFRDIPPHRSRRPNHEEVAQGRLLYKPSHDLQFDLEVYMFFSDLDHHTHLVNLLVVFFFQNPI